MGVQFSASDPEAVRRFAETNRKQADEFSLGSPENAWLIAVDWEFSDEDAALIEGGLRPQVTEDLWRIDLHDSRLYFRRSWTGQLAFMSNFVRVPTAGARITRLWIPGDEPFSDQPPEYLAAYIRHLIDTHLLGVLSAFPIPPEFPADDQQIASFVFHSVGRRGWLAEYFIVGKSLSRKAGQGFDTEELV